MKVRKSFSAQSAIFRHTLNTLTASMMHIPTMVGLWLPQIRSSLCGSEQRTRTTNERTDELVLLSTLSGSGGFDYPCRNTAFPSCACQAVVVSISDSSTAESISTNYD